MLNPTEIKKDFPIFNRLFDDKEIVYLDNGATTQKPQIVIDSLVDFYSNHNANVHRGIYALSEEATDMYETARKTIADFIGASVSEEVVFTKGSTESLNMVAYGYFLPRLESGLSIITTKMEHHSNLVPWQQIAKTKGCTLKKLDFNEEGAFDLAQLEKLLDESVKVVAITHVSNVLGSETPLKRIVEMAHKVGALVVVDGSQAVPHMPVNMQSLDCDFYTFSGHKMCGPTGIGVLYGKREYLDVMTPIQFGGGMISKVDLDDAAWAPSPEKFEAGTPNIAGAIALATAAEYLQTVGLDQIQAHEKSLVSYALLELSQVAGLHVLGTDDPKKRAGIISFFIDKIHSHDVAAILSNYNVCVRSGHHCTMPLHKRMEVNSSTRASFYLYNTREDVDKLVEALWKALEVLK